MTIDEQVENFKSIGLIKAYSLNLKPKNGNYVDKVTFEQLLKNRIIENKNIEKTP